MSEIDVRHFEVDAHEERVSFHTFGIVSDFDSLPGTGIGTGVAVRWDHRTLFLTAAHVIENTPPERIGFFFRHEGTIEREYVERKPLGTRFTTRQQLRIIEIRILDPLDLAAICVAPEVEQEQNVLFAQLDRSHISPAIGQTVMVQGFPSAISERVGPGRHAANRAIAYQKVVRAPAATNFDGENEFAIDYTFGEGIPPDGIDPRGFSGAGAWHALDEAQPLIWVPQPKLAGIIATYYPRKRTLVGIRIEAILRLLEKHFP